MTQDEKIAAIAEAERRAYRAWWGGGRAPIDDRHRWTEHERRRRLAILEAIEPTNQADLLTFAKEAVEAIVHDLTDRRGLKWEWARIDADVHVVIKLAWAKLIADAYLVGGDP